jgi:hypothetical protein
VEDVIKAAQKNNRNELKPITIVLKPFPVYKDSDILLLSKVPDQ